MRKITSFILILFLFSCSKDGLESLNVKEQKQSINMSNSISFEFLNNLRSSSSSKVSELSNRVDSRYNYFDLNLKNIKIIEKNNDISFNELAKQDVNESLIRDWIADSQLYKLDIPVFSIPITLGEHSMFALAEISLNYWYDFAVNGNKKTKKLEANLFCAGPLCKMNNNYGSKSNIVNITKDTDELVLDSELKVVNGPLIMRFEELCNHPLGVLSFNKHWKATRNKALEYYVFVDYYKRDIDDIINVRFDSQIDRTEEYKVIIFYHSIFVYKNDGTKFKLVSSSREGDDNSGFCFDNGGYCDIQISNLDMAKVRIKAQSYHLKDYPDIYYDNGSVFMYFYDIYHGNVLKKAQRIVDYISNGISNQIGSVWNSNSLTRFKKAKDPKWISNGRIKTEVGKIRKYLIHLKTFDGRERVSSQKKCCSVNHLDTFSVECLLDSFLDLK